MSYMRLEAVLLPHHQKRLIFVLLGVKLTTDVQLLYSRHWVLSCTPVVCIIMTPVYFLQRKFCTLTSGKKKTF